MNFVILLASYGMCISEQRAKVDKIIGKSKTGMATHPSFTTLTEFLFYENHDAVSPQNTSGCHDEAIHWNRSISLLNKKATQLIEKCSETYVIGQLCDNFNCYARLIGLDADTNAVNQDIREKRH